MSGKPYQFMWATQLSSNLPPQVTMPSTIYLSPGSTYYVEAQDPEEDTLTFGSHSNTIRVSSNGVLRAPTTPGTYTGTVYVFDTSGEWDAQDIEVVVG